MSRHGGIPRNRRLSLSILLTAGLVSAACPAGGTTGRTATNDRETGEVSEAARARRAMVTAQIESRGIRDPDVLEAMRRAPREAFVPESLRDEAFADHPLPIGERQTISQPYIVALMTQLADVDRGDKVLEVGTGSGYQAAVLAEMGARVFTIEIIEPLAQRARDALERLGYEGIEYRVGDGYAGWKEHAPFDAILVTAAPDHVPQPLVEQLATGGHMVIPVGAGYQELLRITRTPEGLERESVLPVRFVPMTGEAQRPRRTP